METLDLTFVRFVQEKAELRERNARAEEYISEVTERELYIPTGYFLLIVALALLTLAIVFGGGV